MNERIKLLVKQAGLNIDGYGYPIWGCLHGEDEKKEFLEKFAELLVQECVGICEGKTDHLDPNMYEVWRGALACASDIKVHFGVEK
jgi:hypothetical protein